MSQALNDGTRHTLARMGDADRALNDPFQPLPPRNQAEEPAPVRVDRVPVNTGRLAPIITGGSVTTA